jgi:hypothetical protein
LFALLSADVASCVYPDDKEIDITSGPLLVARGSGSDISVSDHEDADTRICLHVQDAIKKDLSALWSVQLTICCCDIPDVVALLTTLASAFKLWVEFGKGKTLRYTLFIFRLRRILQ